tara:strand:+ start:29287 stop:30402 length:1116 start_codon:yes stop_codon:yes gene_type:complete
MKTTTQLSIGLCMMSMTALASAQPVNALRGPANGESIAYDINDWGQVVGQSNSGISISSTLWDSNGTATTLAHAAGYNLSLAYAINNNGQVVGYSENSMGSRTATLWDGTRTTDLGADMNAVGSSAARDINDNGTVVGSAAINPGFSKGFVWGSEGYQVAGTQYQGGSNLSVNNDGVMVGHSFFFGDPDTASISTPDGRGGFDTRDLGPAGFTFSIATAINNNGMSVGHTNFGNGGAWQAAIFTSDLLGQPSDPMLLGSLDGLNISEANDVNDSGMIVGYSWDGTHSGLDSRAWAWKAGEMFDLNDLLEEDSMFELLIEATGVNNNGDIVGYGLLHDGTTSAFVIEGFVPAPGSMAALLLGGMAAARRRRL